MKKRLHPHSLANLQRGHVPSDPVLRQQRARRAGQARAAKALTAIERGVLQQFGMPGLRGFKLGLRVGANRQYQAARKSTEAS